MELAATRLAQFLLECCPPALREGPEGFEGGLSAGKYVTITGASPATATRDLADLMDKDALRRIGERRHARYHIAIPTRKVPPVVLDEHGNFS